MIAILKCLGPQAWQADHSLRYAIQKLAARSIAALSPPMTMAIALSYHYRGRAACMARTGR